jgi:hypothetical protein
VVCELGKKQGNGANWKILNKTTKKNTSHATGAKLMTS